jgi:cytidylate kinase
MVTGPTGSGKSTVGRALATTFDVPAVEIGVVLRLASLHAHPRSDEHLASLIWRWYAKSRLDFNASSVDGLAAMIPRLDGATNERALWTDVDPQRLAELARGEVTQQALTEIAMRVAATHGAVIIGRVSAEIGTQALSARIELDASPRERTRRKRSQLQGVGLDSTAHDWFIPGLKASTPTAMASAEVLDTTTLSIVEMLSAAEAMTKSAREDRGQRSILLRRAS